jgi:CRP-like cAMP-binding protein
MAHPDIGQILTHAEAFDGLTDEEVQLLVGRCQRIAFLNDDIIVREGHPGEALYIVVSGQLKVFLPRERDGSGGQRASDVPLNTLQRGDCFGEYSFIDRGPASASIVGMSSGELLKIATADFDALLAQHDRMAKTIYHNLLRILIRRLRAREQEYDVLLLVE